MPGILTVEREDLERFDSESAVDFFRELLWAEASAIGIGKDLITVPGVITARDGGVDAEVQAVAVTGGQGLIKRGLTRYQIKTGRFQPSRPSDLRSLFFGTSGELHPRVASCFERGGTFVAVLFGWDGTEQADDEILSRCRQVLPEKFQSARIEIWGQNKLQGFLTHFPSLALDASGRQTLRFQTHSSWSNGEEMRRRLEIDAQQVAFIENLQTAVRGHDQAIHVRISGDAGCGKTRLVLEATRADDLRPLVAYYESP